MLYSTLQQDSYDRFSLLPVELRTAVHSDHNEWSRMDCERYNPHSELAILGEKPMQRSVVQNCCWNRLHVRAEQNAIDLKLASLGFPACRAPYRHKCSVQSDPDIAVVTTTHSLIWYCTCGRWDLLLLPRRRSNATEVEPSSACSLFLPSCYGYCYGNWYHEVERTSSFLLPNHFPFRHGETTMIKEMLKIDGPTT